MRRKEPLLKLQSLALPNPLLYATPTPTPWLLAMESGPLGNDSASLPVEIKKRPRFRVCSFFIMLNGQGQPGRTLNSFSWWSQAAFQGRGW